MPLAGQLRARSLTADREMTNLLRPLSASGDRAVFSGANSPFTDPTFRPSGWRPTVWREIPVTHWISVSSEFPSLKMDRRIGCESLLESDMACLLEVDSHVISYREQPVGPDWHDGYGWTAGTARDFWVVTTEGPYLLEVKSATELADPQAATTARQQQADHSPCARDRRRHGSRPVRCTGGHKGTRQHSSAEAPSWAATRKARFRISVQVCLHRSGHHQH